VHKTKNILSKVPERAKAEVKEAVRAAYQAPSPALARMLADEVKARYERRYPAAVSCFLEDFEACIAHLHLPPAHRRTCRTTNLLERLFVEERRRTKVAPVMFGERAVMKLMFAALIRASESWRGIRISEFERRQLERLEDQLKKGFKERHEPVTKESSTLVPIYSSERT
jgi:transposase-like protein